MGNSTPHAGVGQLAQPRVVVVLAHQVIQRYSRSIVQATVNSSSVRHHSNTNGYKKKLRKLTMYLSLPTLTECQKTTQGHSHPGHQVIKILKVTQATQCLRTFKTANPMVSPLSVNTTLMPNSSKNLPTYLVFLPRCFRSSKFNQVSEDNSRSILTPSQADLYSASSIMFVLYFRRAGEKMVVW
jgi:hypothetical protein